MSELLDLLNQSFEEIVLTACDRIFDEGVRQMRTDLEQAGLVLTQELKNSIYSERTKITDTLEAQFRAGMRGYGRFKDMKSITYSKVPNITDMMEFIESIGVEKFMNNDTVDINCKQVKLFVPGYYTDVSRARTRKALTHDRAKERIAWRMGIHRMNQNTIKRAKDGGFYNVNKGEIYVEIRDYLSKKLPETWLKTMAEYYDKPFYKKGGWWE